MGTPFEKLPIGSLTESVEKIHNATQGELLQSALEKLRGNLSAAGIKCVEDREYLRLKRNDKQVGIVFNMPDGNRRTVRFDSDLEKIITEFESSIPPESIFVTVRDEDLTDFTFFPNLTEREVEVLKTEIEPINGHIVIVQGEYVIVNKLDQVHTVSTFGIGPCRGIIIYDPDNGRAAITHSDTNYADISLIKQMRADLIKAGSDPNKLKFYGTPNIDPEERKYVIDKIFSETAYELPSEFTFDCESGLISSFDIKSLPQSANLDKRMEDEIGIRLKHNIPYIKKGVKKEFAAKEENQL